MGFALFLVDVSLGGVGPAAHRSSWAIVTKLAQPCMCNRGNSDPVISGATTSDVLFVGLIQMHMPDSSPLLH